MNTAILEVESNVTGFTSDGTVNITCGVHGYASFLGSPTWTRNGAAVSADETKYSISLGEETRLLIYSNGSIGPGLLSTLTISQLSSNDSGEYSCNLANLSRQVWLNVIQTSTSDIPASDTTAAADTTAFTPVGTTQPLPGVYVYTYVCKSRCHVTICSAHIC